MEYYGNALCLTKEELTDGIMSVASYDKLASRGKIHVMRRGGGLGRSALVEMNSLPTKYKEKAKSKYPSAREVLISGWIMSHYELDQKAVKYFTQWATEHQSESATMEKAHLYAVNASVLNACMRLHDDIKSTRKVMGETFDWEMMSKVVEVMRAELGHDLPGSMQRFRKKVNVYRKGGYETLITGKFGNQSARKVDHKTERLILSLAVMPNKPFNTSVLEMYNSFVTCELDVYDPHTGELFNPEDWTDKNGEPKVLSETTICNYLNKPKNKVLIEHALTSSTSFMHEQMPHMHRHSGEFSLSQITMDDVDLTRKLKDTKQRVHAYYAYDVVSQCVLGASYARQKDQSLVVDCFRDMFRLIKKNGWGMPAGIEVENHLMSEYKDGFLQAGVAFPFVHFCAPQNSQEKYAEQMNGAKKKSIIHKNHEGIGRFYGKGKWRMESQKISDETNDLWEDKEYFSWDQLVLEDKKDNAEWNNTLHPNQKKYPGMTRWDVLVANINPTLEPLDELTLARYIGEKVETSVRRNSTIRVAYEDWWLSGTEVLEKLAPNDYKVTAYYLPNDEGKAENVYIFQGDRYIDKVEKVETYNRVMAEQTDEDAAKFIEQRKKISKFSCYVNENAVESVCVERRAVLPVSEVPAAPADEDIEVVASPPLEDDMQGYFEYDNMSLRALDDL